MSKHIIQELEALLDAGTSYMTDTLDNFIVRSTRLSETTRKIFLYNCTKRSIESLKPYSIKPEASSEAMLREVGAYLAGTRTLPEFEQAARRRLSQTGLLKRALSPFLWETKRIEHMLIGGLLSTFLAIEGNDARYLFLPGWVLEHARRLPNSRIKQGAKQAWKRQSPRRDKAERSRMERTHLEAHERQEVRWQCLHLIALLREGQA